MTTTPEGAPQGRRGLGPIFTGFADVSRPTPEVLVAPPVIGDMSVVTGAEGCGERADGDNRPNTTALEENHGNDSASGVIVEYTSPGGAHHSQPEAAARLAHMITTVQDEAQARQQLAAAIPGNEPIYADGVLAYTVFRDRQDGTVNLVADATGGYDGGVFIVTRDGGVVEELDLLDADGQPLPHDERITTVDPGERVIIASEHVANMLRAASRTEPDGSSPLSLNGLADLVARDASAREISEYLCAHTDTHANVQGMPHPDKSVAVIAVAEEPDGSVAPASAAPEQGKPRIMRLFGRGQGGGERGNRRAAKLAARLEELYNDPETTDVTRHMLIAMGVLPDQSLDGLDVGNVDTRALRLIADTHDGVRALYSNRGDDFDMSVATITWMYDAFSELTDAGQGDLRSRHLSDESIALLTELFTAEATGTGEECALAQARRAVIADLVSTSIGGKAGMRSPVYRKAVNVLQEYLKVSESERRDYGLALRIGGAVVTTLFEWRHMSEQSTHRVQAGGATTREAWAGWGTVGLAGVALLGLYRAVDGIARTQGWDLPIGLGVDEAVSANFHSGDTRTPTSTSTASSSNATASHGRTTGVDVAASGTASRNTATSSAAEATARRSTASSTRGASPTSGATTQRATGVPVAPPTASMSHASDVATPGLSSRSSTTEASSTTNRTRTGSSTTGVPASPGASRTDARVGADEVPPRRSIVQDRSQSGAGTGANTGNRTGSAVDAAAYTIRRGDTVSEIAERELRRAGVPNTEANRLHVQGLIASDNPKEVHQLGNDEHGLVRAGHKLNLTSAHEYIQGLKGSSAANVAQGATDAAPRPTAAQVEQAQQVINGLKDADQVADNLGDLSVGQGEGVLSLLDRAGIKDGILRQEIVDMIGNGRQPDVIKLREALTTGDRPFGYMQELPGGKMELRLSRPGAISEAEAHRVAEMLRAIVEEYGDELEEDLADSYARRAA